jgi:hypothetical protein
VTVTIPGMVRHRKLDKSYEPGSVRMATRATVEDICPQMTRMTRRGQAATVLAYEWTEIYERRNFGAFYNFHLRQTLENLRTARRF